MHWGVRDALRHVSRASRFAAPSIATLALALGGIGAIAILLNALVLRPLNLREPERLAIVTVATDRGVQGFISLAAFDELSRTQDVFDSLCATTGVSSVRVEMEGTIVNVSRESVSGQCAEVMGERPILGRPIAARDVAGAELVAVISHRFWQQLGGAPSIVGRTLRMEGVPVAIIGVMPAGFSSIGVEQSPDVTLPLSAMARVYNSPAVLRAYYLVGRRRADVDERAAQARLATLWPAILTSGVVTGDPLAQRYMHGMRAIRVEGGSHGISPLRTRYARPLMLLCYLSLTVLLLACLNIGGLLLARVVTRENELHVRMALGASRSDLSRQLLVEGLILSLAATLLAVPLAFWFATSLGVMVWTATLPMTLNLQPDLRVLAALLLGGLICGSIVSAPGVAFWSLHQSGPATRRGRSVIGAPGLTGKALTVAQLALCLALLFGAGTFTQRLLQLRAIDPGYRSDGLIVLRPVPRPGPPPAIDMEAYHREMLGQLAALDGVRGAALSIYFPFASAERVALVPIRIEQDRGTADGNALVETTSPGFFELLGIDLLNGRTFSRDDDRGHPRVAIVNASLARLLFGEGTAIGQRIRIGPSPQAPLIEVVGVVRDASPGDLRLSGLPMVYRPIFQEPAELQNPVIVLRTANRPALAQSIRQTVESPGHAYVTSIKTVDEQIALTQATERTLVRLSGFVGALGLLLAGIGVYALLSYNLSRRRREMGLRLALGASARALETMILRQGLTLTAIGVALGIPLALGTSRVARSLLHELPPASPAVLAGAAAVLVIVGLLAALAPARRASRTDGATSLRAE